MHVLVGPAVGLGERGPQHLVARDDVAQRGLEGVVVEVAAQPHGERDVVGRAGVLEPVEEPQPVLGPRQRDELGSRARGDRAPGAARRGEVGGQLLDAGGLEEGADADLHPELRADPADQAGGEQRVAAEVEEPGVRRGGLVEAEHLGVDPCERALRVGARLPPGVDDVGAGERVTVELAVGRERERLERGPGDGDHVVGQRRARRGADGLDVDLGARGRDEPGREAAGAGGVGLDGDGRGGNARRLLGQDGLDLAELDAEAADLHLVVDAADERDGPVAPTTGQVAGAVHPRAGRTVGVGDEPLGGLSAPTGVPAGEGHPGEVELARDARGDGAQRRVEDVGRDPVDRRAEHGGLVVGQVGDDRVDARLGGAVEVDAADRGVRPQLAPQRRADGLAAQQRQAQPGVAEALGSRAWT